jgi:copper transport protein
VSAIGSAGTVFVRRATAALTLILWLLSAFVTPVFAHSALLESMPASGATLTTPPTEILLRFNEPVMLIAMSVSGPGGATIASLAADPLASETLRLALPEGLADGLYVVSYRVASRDGHPIPASFTFGLGVPAAPLPAAAAPAEVSPVLRGILIANQALHLGLLLAAVGGTLFWVFTLGRTHPLAQSLRPCLALLIGGAALAGIANIGINGAVLQGGAFDTLLSAAAWSVGMSSSIGASAIFALAGLLLLCLGLAVGRVPSLPLLLSGCVVALLSLVVTGHAASAPPAALASALVFVHGLAAAYWLGSLWPLVLTLRYRRLEEVARVVRRFSNTAQGAVALLLLAGGGLSVLQLRQPDAVLSTGYGLIWLVKIGFVLLLLAVAAWNRLRLTPALRDDNGATAAKALRRSIAVEFGLVLVLLVATAGLGNTPPPRTGMAANEAMTAATSTAAPTLPVAPPAPALPQTVSVIFEGGTAEIVLDPARTGGNAVLITVNDANGVPVTAVQAKLEMTQSVAGIGPIEAGLVQSGPGRFIATDAQLPIPGIWTFQVKIWVTDFDLIQFEAEIPTRSGV